MEDLSERVQKLESELAKLQSGCAKFDAVETQMLVIKDAKGIIKAILEPTDEGARLTLRSDAVNVRIELKVDSEDCFLKINDAEGNRRLVLGLGEKGPGFGFCDGGRERMWMRLGDDGALFAIADSEGTPRLSFGAMATDESGFMLVDPQGTARAEFSLTPNGPLIRLNDKDGEPFFYKPD